MAKRRWGIRRPLQIESFRRGLPGGEERDDLLRELQHCRENLDAVVFALSNPSLAADRRLNLQEILLRYQGEHERCLERLGVPAKSRDRDPLWFFNQLEPQTRAHLAAILGVSEEPPYYPVLEIKAEEYLGQESAFRSLAQDRSFSEREVILRESARAALALTLSGSLIQISEPINENQARRYLYQNIYGNAHPPGGVLVLDRDLSVGHRVRSVELTSSPVRRLLEVNEQLSWRAQSETFEQMSHTLTSLGSHSRSKLVSSGWQPQMQTGLVRLSNHEAAARVFAQEYREAMELFSRLRAQFTEGDAEEAKKVEAELMTQCHLLQTGARELGFDTCPLEEALEFTTTDGQCYQISSTEPLRVTVLPRGNSPEVILIKVSVGRQRITSQAPLCFIGQNGCLVEVTEPVVRFLKRGAV